MFFRLQLQLPWEQNLTEVAKQEHQRDPDPCALMSTRLEGRREGLVWHRTVHLGESSTTRRSWTSASVGQILPTFGAISAVSRCWVGVWQLQSFQLQKCNRTGTKREQAKLCEYQGQHCAAMHKDPAAPPVRPISSPSVLPVRLEGSVLKSLPLSQCQQVT